MNEIIRIKCGNGNCFIIKGKDSSILVDTSRVNYRKKILEQCKKENVKLIILTHGHVDHVENAAFLSKALNVPIAMNKADYELTGNNMLEELTAEKFLGKIVLNLSIKSFKNDVIEPFEPMIYLKNHDNLSDYGIDAEIIELAGHTKGSVGIKVGKDDFIVGDALMNLFYPTISMLYGDFENMKKSAEIIRASNVKTIHFGHGESVPISKVSYK